MSVPFFGVNHNKGLKQRNAVGSVTSLIVAKFGVDVTNVMVTEVQCFDPNCVPIETVIVILGNSKESKEDRWIHKVLKPIVDVTADDIDQSLSLYTSWKEGREWSNRIKSLVINLVEENQLDRQVVSEYLKQLASELDKPQIPDDIPSVPAKATITRVPMQSRTADVNAVAPPPPVKAVDATLISPSIARVPMQTTASAVHVVPAAAKQSESAVIVTSDISDVTMTPGGHMPGSRQRGCPCCDPDNLDNVIDKLLFMDKI